MNNKESEAKQHAWITEYLYGELNAGQREVFEQALANDAQLKQRYDKHMAVDDFMARGSRPYISEERMQGLRWATFRRLRQVERPSLIKRLSHLWRQPLPLGVQMAGMAMMLVVGLLLHPLLMPSKPRGDSAPSSQGVLSLVGHDDYQIVDVQLQDYDQGAGEVQFSFALNSQSQVRGKLANPQIRQLLAQSLQGNSGDSARLQLTELFGRYLQSEDIKAALIATLSNDPNPGVRYNAVEHLVKIAHQPDVRQALRQVLVNDVNPGIRVEAFLALTSGAELEPELVEILRSHSIDDANTLIRERSKKLLDGMTVVQEQNPNISI